MQEHRLTIAGHTIAANEYNAHRDSTPIIFIHGITDSIDSWALLQAPIVQEQYHWFALSLLGHYPARMPDDFNPADLTPELIGDLTTRAIKQLVGERPVILVGHSTGGFTAYCVALHAPHIVEKMLILDGFAHGRWGASLRIFQIAANLPAGELLFPALFRSVTHEPGYQLSANMMSADRTAMRAHPHFLTALRSIIQSARKTNLRRDWYPFFHNMPHTDITPRLSQIQTPTRIVHGSRDPVIPPAHVKAMHAHLPNSTLHWIDGAGHLPTFERPDALHAQLTAFLQGDG